nr:MAG TPA: hypothetical protein [Caudoviricetes sp.]DAS27900.1 MAG TPA: hypothetical protein [Caudoviricetes sp.]DAW70997.1 MAG TPA: hypothetical protein [Caudoviricetes sp.]DAY06082.1 MAG TPA: hypothetical protein [Caudoviricetes sp.]
MSISANAITSPFRYCLYHYTRNKNTFGFFLRKI